MRFKQVVQVVAIAMFGFIFGTCLIRYIDGELRRQPMGDIELSANLKRSQASVLRFIPVGTPTTKARAFLVRDGFSCYDDTSDGSDEITGVKMLRFSDYTYSVILLVKHEHVIGVRVSRVQQGSI